MAEDATCSCDEAALATMEARIAELEATSVTFDNGSLVVPTPEGFPDEGGQLTLSPATSGGSSFYLDVNSGNLRMIERTEAQTEAVVFAFDSASHTLAVYGDLSVSGVVRAAAFEP